MNLYLLSILAHIVGLVMLAGTTLIGFITNRRFWRLYPLNPVKAEALLELGGGFPAVIGIGMLLLILSGVSLMVQTHGAYGEQLWFRIKFVLILIIIGNSVVARRLNKKVKMVMVQPATTAPLHKQLLSLKTNITLFYAVQLLLLLAIFTLGVFKFN
jgi:uncharacterized membrane protein SirB2